MEEVLGDMIEELAKNLLGETPCTSWGEIGVGLLVRGVVISLLLFSLAAVVMSTGIALLPSILCMTSHGREVVSWKWVDIRCSMKQALCSGFNVCLVLERIHKNKKLRGNKYDARKYH